MPKLKLFKHLSLTRKNVESLHQLPSSPPADANPVVIQQTRTSDIPTTIVNDLFHSPRRTAVQPTLTLAEGITNDIIKKPSISITKPNGNLSGTCTLPAQTQDPQNTSSHPLAVNIPESFTAQVNFRPQKLDLQTRKQRRHQYRLCYHCRQTGHLKSSCPQLIQK